MSNYLDRFNNIYDEMLDDIKNIYSVIQKQDKKSTSTSNLKHFVLNILPYMDDISCKNVDAFKYKHKKCYIINGTRFNKILNNKLSNAQNIKVIWTYLQTLYIMAYNAPETQVIVENNIEHINFDLIKKSLDNDNYTIFIQNFINCKDNFNQVNKNPECDKPECDDPNKEDKTINNETNDETNNPDEAECQLPGFLQNSLIGNLAKELSEEINPTELGDLENFSNPTDLIAGLFGGGSGGGLSNLIGTVVSKLDSKMKSGEIDQNKLLSEAQGMMGSLNLFGNMMNPSASPTTNTETSTETNPTASSETNPTTSSETKPTTHKKKRRKRKKKRR